MIAAWHPGAMVLPPVKGPRSYPLQLPCAHLVHTAHPGGWSSRPRRQGPAGARSASGHRPPGSIRDGDAALTRGPQRRGTPFKNERDIGHAQRMQIYFALWCIPGYRRGAEINLEHPGWVCRDHEEGIPREAVAGHLCADRPVAGDEPCPGEAIRYATARLNVRQSMIHGASRFTSTAATEMYTPGLT